MIPPSQFRSLLILTITLFILNIASAENQAINLSRLPIARVYASSERKGSHGIQKIFDGSTATSWMSSDHDPWVRVRFTKPVTVQSVAIHAALESAPSTPPEYFE